MPQFFALLLLLFTAESAIAQLSSAEQRQPLYNVSFDQVMALDARQPDLRLSYGEDPLQFGWLWLPARERPASALIVIIHGGCWLNEYGVDHSFALAGALAESGFAVWSVEYRRSGDPGGGWPGSFEDVLAAIDFRRELSGYGLNSRPFAILGHSAGGHLALLAGAALADREPNLAIVGSLAGISDLIGYGRGANDCQQAVSGFMGGGTDLLLDSYRQANPAELTPHPRTWMFHGGADAIVPPSQADMAGTTLRMLPGAGHFDWIHPQTAAFALLLATLELVL